MNWARRKEAPFRGPTLSLIHIFQKVGIQVGTLQRRKRRSQHIGGHHLIFALPEDPLPVLLACLLYTSLPQAQEPVPLASAP